MINLIWFETEEDLQKVTGLNREQLESSGFPTSGFESVLVSDKMLHYYDEDGDVEWISLAYEHEEGSKLAGILANELWYHDGKYKYVEYEGKHFYFGIDN